MPKIIHALLTLALIALAIPAAAQEPGIYINGARDFSNVDHSTLKKAASNASDSDIIYVYLEGKCLQYKTYINLSRGTWTFHGNDGFILTYEYDNEALRLNNVNVTFEGFNNDQGLNNDEDYEDGQRGPSTLFAANGDNDVTFTDCTLHDVAFKFTGYNNTLTFTSGEYWDLRNATGNDDVEIHVAGGTFYSCSGLFDEAHVTFAPGLTFKDPNDDTPLTLNEWGQVVDADGFPATAFTCVMQPPVVSYVTSTGLSGTFTSMHEAISAFTDTKESMHVDFTLLADISPESRLRFDGMHATLNLGSHRITFDNEPGGGSSYHFVCVNGDLTLNADEGGGMDFHVPSPENSNIFGLGVIDGATMTITSGSYRGNGIIVISYGTVNISGGTFHSVDEPAAYWREGKANISGGRFTTSNNKWAAIYSCGNSLVDGYSFWIHDSTDASEPQETYDYYDSYYGGYVYNISDYHAGRDISVGKQSTFARLTANGISARYTNLAKAFEDAQNYESATITLEGGQLIGCHEPIVIERGNITFDYGNRTTLFTFRDEEPAITIQGGTLTVRGDEEKWCKSAEIFFYATDSGTLNVESGEYISQYSLSLYADDDSHINITGGILYSKSSSRYNVYLSTKYANVTGGIFYSYYGNPAFFSVYPCMSDEWSFYLYEKFDPEHELSFSPGIDLYDPYFDWAHYVAVAPSTGPRVTVTAHNGAETTTRQFYRMEDALAFATEQESAHIDVHQHDGKLGAYRMDKGDVTIDLHGHYLHNYYDTGELEFSNYVQHPDNYGAIVVSGGHLTINADTPRITGYDDIPSLFSDHGCIVATGTGTIELNGGYYNNGYGMNIVASEQGRIVINDGISIASVSYRQTQGSNYNSANLATLNGGHIDVNGGRFEGLNTLYTEGGEINVYGGTFKSVKDRPAATLKDGMHLYGGRFICKEGQTAIYYSDPEIDNPERFFGNDKNIYVYYTGDQLDMTLEPWHGDEVFVLYSYREQNNDPFHYQYTYANDVYVSTRPVFQVQHLTHIIDEVKRGKSSASLRDIEEMVQKVLNN